MTASGPDNPFAPPVAAVEPEEALATEPERAMARTAAVALAAWAVHRLWNVLSALPRLVSAVRGTDTTALTWSTVYLRSLFGVGMAFAYAWLAVMYLRGRRRFRAVAIAIAILSLSGPVAGLLMTWSMSASALRAEASVMPPPYRLVFNHLLPASLFAMAVIALVPGGPSRRRLMVGRGAVALYVLALLVTSTPLRALVDVHVARVFGS